MPWIHNRQPTPVRPVRFALVWQVLLAGLAAGALVWWWNMPHGFPPEHPRFWVNQVLPWALVGLAVSGSYAIENGRAALAQAVLLTLPIGTAAALVAAASCFPLSSRRFWLPGSLAVLGLQVLWVYSTEPRRLGRLGAITMGLLAAAAGGAAVFAQRGPEPDTRPLNMPPPEVVGEVDVARPPGRLELPGGWSVRPSDGAVLGTAGALHLELAPLLWFESVSPDRCWTILAPRAIVVGPNRALAALLADEQEIAAAYQTPLVQTLIVRPIEQGVDVDAFSQLEAPVYSHLNAFCELHVRGHKRLSLRFSPCPDTEIEVLPADYPAGRPARAAVWMQGDVLRIVEARSGEKGPFATLAEGPLARGAPLTITLCDEGRPVGEFTLADFAAQAGQQLSPTAGWGLPVNAIEFTRLGDTPESPAAIWVTLSATSIGRGWDSVGHGAGVYRNRVTVRAVVP